MKTLLLFLPLFLLPSCITFTAEKPIYAFCQLNQAGELILVENYEDGDQTVTVCNMCEEYGEGAAACLDE